MGTALNALNTAPQPLTARRPAASTLPSFELPPPTSFQLAHLQKYPSSSGVTSGSTVSVGNLLTPPSTNASGDGPVSLPPGSNSTPALPSSSEGPPFSSAYWPAQNSYNYGSGSSPHPGWHQGSTAVFPPRGSYSPSLGPLGRNPPNGPPTTDSMSQSYEIHQLPPFQQQPLAVSSPTSNTPMLSHHQHPQHPQHPMAHPMLGVSTSSASSPHQLADPYAAPKSLASPYPPSVSSQQYPGAYGAPSPVTPSGLGIHAATRMPSVSSQPPPMQPPQIGYNRPPWPSYSLPAMTGPVMTNMHNPGGQMSVIGNIQSGFLPGYNSSQLASMHQIYGGHAHQPHGQPAPINDRPFKCDECPQSFNRNHDLKRHKRIHLSVKPFPCNHCDKSFSRKDALKRHLLVKGCGKNTSDSNSLSTAKDDDTLTKTDSTSEKASPVSNGHV